LRALLDTNVVSEWVKTRPSPEVDAWLRLVDPTDLHISVVTMAEVARGIEKLPAGQRKTRLEAWSSAELLNYFADNILGVDVEVARCWGAICAAAERRGRRMGPMDAFLAATAEVHGLTLVTRNVKDFEVWRGPVFNPWIETGPA